MKINIEKLDMDLATQEIVDKAYRKISNVIESEIKENFQTNEGCAYISKIILNDINFEHHLEIEGTYQIPMSTNEIDFYVILQPPKATEEEEYIEDDEILEDDVKKNIALKFLKDYISNYEISTIEREISDEDNI